MQPSQQVYHLKVDSSGRIVLPADARVRHHIQVGDTVVVLEDAEGLRIRTLDQIVAAVQAEFARIVPRGVLLSEEILQDRRSEQERD